MKIELADENAARKILSRNILLKLVLRIFVFGCFYDFLNDFSTIIVFPRFHFDDDPATPGREHLPILFLFVFVLFGQPGITGGSYMTYEL